MLAMVLLKLMVSLIDLVVKLLAQTAAFTVAEQPSLTIFVAVIVAKPTLAFLVLKPTLLDWGWWIDTTLLGTAACVWYSGIPGGLLTVFLIIYEVPALRKMCAEILNNRTSEAQGYVGPSHARAYRSVKFVVLPVRDVCEI